MPYLVIYEYNSDFRALLSRVMKGSISVKNVIPRMDFNSSSASLVDVYFFGETKSGKPCSFYRTMSVEMYELLKKTVK